MVNPSACGLSAIVDLDWREDSRATINGPTLCRPAFDRLIVQECEEVQ